MYLPPDSLCNITRGYVSTRDNWKTPHVRNHLPSERRQPKIELSRSQPRALQDLSTWMRVSENEMAESELMTACLPARCDLKMDFITFSSTIRIQAACLGYLNRNILEGNGWVFFSRHEISPNPLALSVVFAMHLSVPSTPISHWANNFRSNETAISIRHECCVSPGLLLESRVHCAGWSLAGRGGHNEFREGSGVLRAGDQTQQLFGLVLTFQQAPGLDACRFGLDKICQVSEGLLPRMCLDTRLTTTQVSVHQAHLFQHQERFCFASDEVWRESSEMHQRPPPYLAYLHIWMEA